MNQSPLVDISQTLVNIGEGLYFKPADNANKLRKGLQKIEHLSKSMEDKDIEFMTYFLQCFIDQDVWNNLAMRSSQRLEDEIIDDIMQTIGSHFVEIGKRVREKEFYGCYEEYVKMVHDYESQYAEIKEVL